MDRAERRRVRSCLEMLREAVGKMRSVRRGSRAAEEVGGAVMGLLWERRAYTGGALEKTMPGVGGGCVGNCAEALREWWWGLDHLCTALFTFVDWDLASSHHVSSTLTSYIR